MSSKRFEVLCGGKEEMRSPAYAAVHVMVDAV